MTNDSTIPPGGPARPPHPFAPGRMFGRYRIDRKLGEGGMGAVYLAHDTLLDRPVALKVPTFFGRRDTAAARFVREARAAAGLHHPNVCPIYDVGEIDGHHYLCMRYVVGRQLAEVVSPGNPLPVAEAARIVRTVALAMHAAHARGTIHRDLKPANILLDDRGEPVVMDFGLARREESGDTPLSLDGEMMGTPAYMPPEQAAGEVAAMGPASDVYSLGVVLYELLVGEPPFAGEGLGLVAQITFDPPPPPSTRRPGLDAKWDAVVLKALAKKPGERWKTM
jgi:serine/threonine-protein kinase